MCRTRLYALDPFVDGLQKWRMPRGLGAAVVLVCLVGALSATVCSLRDEATAGVAQLPEARKLRTALRDLRSGSAGEGAIDKVQEAAREIDRTAAEATASTPPPAGVQRVQVEDPKFQLTDSQWWGRLRLLACARSRGADSDGDQGGVRSTSTTSSRSATLLVSRNAPRGLGRGTSDRLSCALRNRTCPFNLHAELVQITAELSESTALSSDVQVRRARGLPTGRLSRSESPAHAATDVRAQAARGVSGRRPPPSRLAAIRRRHASDATMCCARCGRQGPSTMRAMGRRP